MKYFLQLVLLTLCFALPAKAQLQTIDFSGASLPGGVTLTRASSATYFNSSYVLSTASSNTARFNYNSSGTLLGLLVEPAATNLCLYSNTFSSWTPSSVTVTSAAFTSPDGTADGWSIAAGGSGDAVTIFQTFSAIPYTTSMWIYSLSGTFNILVQVGGVNSILGPLGGTISRATATATAGVAGTVQIISNQAGAATLGIFGCQIETGPVATSYIPTTSSAATRAADVVTFSQTGGVNYYAFTYQDGTHQVLAASTMCTSGTCTIPTNLHEPNILRIDGYATFPTYTYYLNTAAGGGSDSNNGSSSGTPWLTPNHSVNCGDVILAAASTSYAASNFVGTFGTVTCTAGNNVAWLKCVTFDACKISTTSAIDLQVNNSYWGVQGWEATTSGGPYYGCFEMRPANGAPIHHIIFANDIANGCTGNGLDAYPNADFSASFDYVAFIGNIAYNAAQGNGECYSGISAAAPVALDMLPGTHIFLAGNFSFNNVDPDSGNCSPPTDGEGIIEDTFAGYTQRVVAVNNMLLANGGRGFEVFPQGAFPGRSYTRNNTMWGNNGDTNQSATFCGEWLNNQSTNVESTMDLAVTNATNGCGGNPIYAYYNCGIASIYNDWGYAASGTNYGTDNCGSAAIGPNNTFGVNPVFANPVAPGAPNCGSFASVPACMATVIANFTPATPAAQAYGYQTPTTTSVYDPLYPQWLCTVTNLPSGLITPGCVTGSAVSGGALKGGTLH